MAEQEDTSLGTGMTSLGHSVNASQAQIKQPEMSDNIEVVEPEQPNEEIESVEVEWENLLKPLTIVESTEEVHVIQTIIGQRQKEKEESDDEQETPMSTTSTIPKDVDLQILDEHRTRRDELLQTIQKLGSFIVDVLRPKQEHRNRLYEDITARQTLLTELRDKTIQLQHETQNKLKSVQNVEFQLPSLQNDFQRWSHWHGLCRRTLRIALLRQQNSKKFIDLTKSEQDVNAAQDRDGVSKLKLMLQSLNQLHDQVTTGKKQIAERLQLLEKAFALQANAKQDLEGKLLQHEERKLQLSERAKAWKEAYVPELLKATELLQVAKTERDELHQTYMAKLDWENHMLDMEDIRNNLERDVTEPDWLGNPAEWANEHQVQQTRFDIADGAMSWDQPMKLVPNITTIKIWIAKKPFDAGTFRQAFYAMDTKGRKWVVKRFHLERSRQIDATSAERIVRENRLVHATVKQFQGDLAKAGTGVELNYIDVFMLTELHSPRVWMMEELLDQWDRWQNNQDYVAEGAAGELFSAHSHYTYHKYDKKMIVTDHQGYAVSDTEYLLSDPGIHLLQPHLGLFQSIHTDLGANRGATGERDFLENHQCNSICELLQLPALQIANPPEIPQTLKSPLADSDSESD